MVSIVNDDLITKNGVNEMNKDLIFNKDAFNDLPEYCEQSLYLKKGMVLGVPYDMENLQLKYTCIDKKIIINIIADMVDKSVMKVI